MESQGGDETKNILEMAGGFTWENPSPPSGNIFKGQLLMKSLLSEAGDRYQDYCLDHHDSGPR